MTGYNLADLEAEIVGDGWSVEARDFVSPHSVPGHVSEGGYRVALTSPAGETFQGEGTTRSDAMRGAAGAAGLLTDGIHLI